MKHLIFLLISLCLISCSTDKEKMLAENDSIINAQSVTQVRDVGFTGEENAYVFEVTIESPDTGCDQYADWWEVVDSKGELVYRRILDHSHVTEQPFTRTGESMEISGDDEVYVRLHMNNSGYATKAVKGSVADGFQAVELEEDFAPELEEKAPLPDGCAF